MFSILINDIYDLYKVVAPLNPTPSIRFVKGYDIYKECNI